MLLGHVIFLGIMNVTVEHVSAVVMAVEKHDGIVAENDVDIFRKVNFLIGRNLLEKAPDLTMNPVVIALNENFPAVKLRENFAGFLIAVPA